ncbi:(2Fe-2S)-binding protein [Alkalihalobacillus sp. MEB130]|uniref:(2Fe-2S)-binding protein n=1 Tax=Alkalihalobacillus sp. MEB130 TaxID=2976704 RepID=UPI0028DD65DC|nr:(2Fe-2S)-binding protein [Alkalihalobacillus sp. MEB130]MDT8862922.1 (2Fe-2S)-binding protein [Alkalihalobacillus sp. MEB130]
MKSMRVEHHPILGDMEKQQRVTIYFDNQPYEAYKGDTIASALLASGVRTLRVHEDKETPRGIYCNIGHCFECRVTVNGVNTVRACVTSVEENMVIESGKSFATSSQKGGQL